MVNKYTWFKNSLNAALARLENIFFPGCCIVCGDYSGRDLDICDGCEQQLPWSKKACARCAIELEGVQTDSAHNLCSKCLLSSPPWKVAYSPWIYHPPVAQLIASLKYNRRYSYAKVLAALAADKLAGNYSLSNRPDYLVAPPLHWRRHLKRGFNQSLLLCQLLSQLTGISVFHGIKRVKPTPAQQTLNFQQRQENLTDAFCVTHTAPIQGACIAIVDDVVTTGATATEISQTLLRAGAAEVHLWSLARTPL